VRSLGSKKASQKDDNEEHSIGSAHERKAVKALEWWAWALPIEFIELSESIALWVLNRFLPVEGMVCVS
jgi:hypothetical protein